MYRSRSPGLFVYMNVVYFLTRSRRPRITAPARPKRGRWRGSPRGRWPSQPVPKKSHWVLPCFTSLTQFHVSFCRMEIHAYFFDFLQIITIRSYDIQSYTDCFFGIIATRDLGITNQTSFDVGGNHLLGCGPVTWMDCLDGHNSLV